MVLVGQGSIARRQTGRIDNILYADRNTGERQCSVKRTWFDHLRPICECPNLRFKHSNSIAQFSQVDLRSTGSGLETLKNSSTPSWNRIVVVIIRSFLPSHHLAKQPSLQHESSNLVRRLQRLGDVTPFDEFLIHGLLRQIADRDLRCHSNF